MEIKWYEKFVFYFLIIYCSVAALLFLGAACYDYSINKTKDFWLDLFLLMIMLLGIYVLTNTFRKIKQSIKK